jgi:hypothetical protein
VGAVEVAGGAGCWPMCPCAVIAATSIMVPGLEWNTPTAFGAGLQLGSAAADVAVELREMRPTMAPATRLRERPFFMIEVPLSRFGRNEVRDPTKPHQG